MAEIDMNPDSKKAAWALLRDYNAISVELGLPEVKRFSDRATGLKRLTAMRQLKLAKASSPSTPETQAEGVWKMPRDYKPEFIADHLNSTPETKLTSETETAAFTTTVDPILDTDAPVAEQSAAVATKRGRGKSLSGLILWATDKCIEGNPRREGSWGQKSLQIILNNPGLTLEEFLIRGGRTNDLRWDIQHGNVISEVKPK